MAKKRKAAKQSGSSGPREVDPSEARLKITTYEDIADSEEEYFIAKDRIDFDEEPKSKRQRTLEEEDAFLEPSDEEVFAGSDESEDEEERVPLAPPKSSTKRGNNLGAPTEELDDDEEDQDSGWWGSSKKEYYNADNIETEADALEEEAEARRLQQKKLAKMSEADFMFDQNEWLASTTQSAEDGGEVVLETLKDAEITEDMTPEDRYKLLQALYPELDYLVEELQALQPVLAECQRAAEGKPSQSLEVIKYRVLGTYIASLAGYLAILTSPARDKAGVQRPVDPADLRDHDIMETLVECRTTWLEVQKLKSTNSVVPRTGMLAPREDEEDGGIMSESETSLAEPSTDALDAGKKIKAAKTKAAHEAKQALAIEESLADLSSLLEKPRKVTKSKSASRVVQKRTAKGDAVNSHDDDRSDFGEEDTLDARTAATKAQQRKSLRFYTSQIVQKANRRAGAGRDAGGDMDIPYRERLRDRQARLNAEAERRGQKAAKPGEALGDSGGSGDEEGFVANKDRVVGGDDDEEYYDMVAQLARRKKDDKAARQEALAQAKRGERIVEQETVGEDGKRKITYAIEKNKGLAPRRKKEVRNPRVKKRLKFAEKQKKLKSMRPVYKGGEGKGGYQGELSGIRTGLVKSVKF
ncbi:hypothetical protein VTK73DRAFT_4482 [Phialemonium thermophilum]|uniref:Sas10 C-terminal domain-containing protein n=1 Tax=Phialemonium thermophilum TaxID=223376 RepID=A0ABR3WTF8_9PEZI